MSDLLSMNDHQTTLAMFRTASTAHKDVELQKIMKHDNALRQQLATEKQRKETAVRMMNDSDKQLADKEREITDLEEDRAERIVYFTDKYEKQEQQLTAANAVVDEARKLDELDDKVLVANHADITDEEYDAITDARDLQMGVVCGAVKKYDEWRKLQGGDGDE